MVRPALLYGAETWATTTTGQEARLEVNEMRMLRWMCGLTRRDNIRNEHIRGTTRVVQASTKIAEKRLKWYGHVRRMKGEHIVRRMLDVERYDTGMVERGQRHKQGRMEKEAKIRFSRTTMKATRLCMMAPKMWNELCNSVKLCSSVQEFKHKYKIFLLKNNNY